MIIGSVLTGVIRPYINGATLSKGGGAFILILNRQPVTLNGQVITLREAA